MKTSIDKLFVLLVALIPNLGLQAQQTIFNNTGNTIKVCPGTVITISGNYYHTGDDAELAIDAGGVLEMSGNLINQSMDSLTNGATGEIIVGGDSIYSQGASRFHVLTLNRSEEDSIKVIGNVIITDSLYMQSGNLYSPMDTIFMIFYEDGDTDLETFGDLVNEQSSNRLITTTPGSVHSTKNLTSQEFQDGIDISDLGFHLTLPGSNGVLELTRNSEALPGLENGSIRRNYWLNLESNVSDGSVIMRYFDAELDTLLDHEAELQLFNSQDDGITWQVLNGSCNPTTNEISADGIDGINGIWTASYCSKPAVTITGDLALCPNTEGQINVDIATPEAYAFQWFKDRNELIEETSTDLQFEIEEEPVEFIVQVRDQYGCVSGDTVVVAINPSPEPDLGDDITVCPGTLVVLNAGTGFDSYEWLDQFGNNIGNTQTIEVSDSANYVARVSNELGCFSADTIQVFHFPSPVSNLGDSLSTCGDAYTFGDELINLNPGASFEWTDISGAVISNTAEVTIEQEGNYAIRIINTNGCSLIDTLHVTLNSGELISLSDGLIKVDFKEETITCGDQIVLGANLAELNPGASFLWTRNGETTPSIIAQEDGYYEVMITASNGCSLIAGTQVILFEDDFVDLGEDFSIQCEKAKLDAGLIAEQYMWSTGSNQRTIEVENSGVYWVEVTDANGCVDRDSINVEVLPAIDSTFYLVATEAFIGDTLAFIGLPTSIPDSATWDWDDGSQTWTNFTMFPTHQYDSAGTFQPLMYAMFSNGCEDEYSKVITIIALDEESEGVSEANGRTSALIDKVKIYPNPSNGLFKVEVELWEKDELSYVVTDISGFTIERKTSMSADFHQLDLDIRSVNTGVYILQIVAGSEKRSFQLIVR